MMQQFIRLLKDNDIPISQNQVELFEKYLNTLLKWNRVYNLTSIRKREDILTKHFFDSLTLVKLFETIRVDVEGKDIADFGSGAGFPGVPMKIYFPNINLSLIESIGKKCIFLQMLKRELMIDYEVLCERAEDVDKKFDIVLSRATGKTFDVLKVAKGLLKEGGIIVVMKGKQVEEELRKYTVTLSFKGFPDRKFIVIRTVS